MIDFYHIDLDLSRKRTERFQVEKETFYNILRMKVVDYEGVSYTLTRKHTSIIPTENNIPKFYHTLIFK